MKAYQNDKGVILAVFKGSDGKYSIYQRKDEYSDFMKLHTYHPPRDTRAEAEVDLSSVALYQKKDKSYKLIDFKG